MKTTNYRNMIFSLAAKGGLLLVSALVILPYSTKAQCTQWDVSGKWKAKFSAAPCRVLYVNNQH